MPVNSSYSTQTTFRTSLGLIPANHWISTFWTDPQSQNAFNLKNALDWPNQKTDIDMHRRMISTVDKLAELSSGLLSGQDRSGLDKITLGFKLNLNKLNQDWSLCTKRINVNKAPLADPRELTSLQGADYGRRGRRINIALGWLRNMKWNMGIQCRLINQDIKI